MPAREKEAALANGLRRLARQGPAKLVQLQELIERSERPGQTFNQGDVTKGVNSFALPIRDGEGRPIAALVVSGRSEDFPAARAGEVFDALREEIARIDADRALAQRGSPASR